MRPDWERDGIQLYCADCMDVLPHLSGVDAVVTFMSNSTTACDRIAAKEIRYEKSTGWK